MSATTAAPLFTVADTEELRDRARAALQACGAALPSSAITVTARTPITGEDLFEVPGAGRAEVEAAIAAAKDAFATWRTVPAPVEPREVFAFVISGAKVRNPLAAQGLIGRLAEHGE